MCKGCANKLCKRLSKRLCKNVGTGTGDSGFKVSISHSSTLLKYLLDDNIAWRKGTEELLTKEAITSRFNEKLRELDMAFLKMLNEDKKSMEIANSLIDLRESLYNE